MGTPSPRLKKQSSLVNDKLRLDFEYGSTASRVGGDAEGNADTDSNCPSITLFLNCVVW